MSAKAQSAGSRTNDPNGVRDRLMDAAAAEFQRNGYHGTSMGDITRIAGVTGGAMYHHYPTKKALTLAVIQDRVAPDVKETWIDPIAGAKSTSVGLKLVLDKIIRDIASRGGVRGCPLNNLALELSLVDDDFRAEIAKIFETWQSALGRKLERDGLSSAQNARASSSLATLIIASYSGAMAMAKAQQNSEPLRRTRSELLKLLK